MRLKQFHHFALVVEDIDSSVEWYRSMLDMSVERRFGFPDAGVEIAHVASADGVRIELISRKGSAPSRDLGQDAFGALLNQGAKHVGLLVDDMDGVSAELKRKGAAFVHEITTVEPAGVRNFWITDNSGNLIEFNEWLPR
jgi:catechol 2,3-dioxygenase-like lactoylglutathione lyase family enzyme